MNQENDDVLLKNLDYRFLFFIVQFSYIILNLLLINLFYFEQKKLTE